MHLNTLGLSKSVNAGTLYQVSQNIFSNAIFPPPALIRTPFAFLVKVANMLQTDTLKKACMSVIICAFTFSKPIAP